MSSSHTIVTGAACPLALNVMVLGQMGGQILNCVGTSEPHWDAKSYWWHLYTASNTSTNGPRSCFLSLVVSTCPSSMNAYRWCRASSWCMKARNRIAGSATLSDLTHSEGRDQRDSIKISELNLKFLVDSVLGFREGLNIYLR